MERDTVNEILQRTLGDILRGNSVAGAHDRVAVIVSVVLGWDRVPEFVDIPMYTRTLTVRLLERIGYRVLAVACIPRGARIISSPPVVDESDPARVVMFTFSHGGEPETRIYPSLIHAVLPNHAWHPANKAHLRWYMSVDRVRRKIAHFISHHLLSRLIERYRREGRIDEEVVDRLRQFYKLLREARIPRTMWPLADKLPIPLMYYKGNVEEAVEELATL